MQAVESWDIREETIAKLSKKISNANQNLLKTF